ncbi:MAG TPA: hypothetical protein VJ123_09985 [Anaerolineales bacterium]|nr:hypothetical protein [Anaerolineales bacterium]
MKAKLALVWRLTLLNAVCLALWRLIFDVSNPANGLAAEARLLRLVGALVLAAVVVPGILMSRPVAGWSTRAAERAPRGVATASIAAPTFLLAVFSLSLYLTVGDLALLPDFFPREVEEQRLVFELVAVGIQLLFIVLNLSALVSAHRARDRRASGA